jgi:hypothetical protein
VLISFNKAIFCVLLLCVLLVPVLLLLGVEGTVTGSVVVVFCVLLPQLIKVKLSEDNSTITNIEVFEIRMMLSCLCNITKINWSDSV